MARMSIDDSVQRDPRITKLSQLVGWSRRETGGCLIMDVWPICYDQREHTIAADLVDIAAGKPGFAAAMVESGLAEWARGNAKVRIKGARERIEYLDHQKKAGRVGGLKSAESRLKSSSAASSNPQALGNPSASASASALPSASVPDLVPVQEEEERDLSAASSPLQLEALKARVDAATGDIGRRRARKQPKAREFTPEQRAIATRVLTRLSESSGVRYSGSDPHVGLIVDRLDDGIHELELRAIVAHCASPEASGGRGWEGNERMRQHLSPETLFGPKTHTKYLDPARTQYAKELEKAMREQQSTPLHLVTESA